MNTPACHFPPPARRHAGSAACLLVLLALFPALGQEPEPPWIRGLPGSPDEFPIGVWLQPPSRAAAYRAAGFNLYVGLWQGPTEEQLRVLKAAGLRVICDQNETGLAHRDDPTIVGWMHGDEPDNAQSLGEGRGYGPPIPPERIVADYEQIRRRDPTRPVLLNLGQGVAWDDWHGRGVRTRHPEDYPEYVKGSDIVSFDIYPVTHDRPAVSSNLWFVARGVERLVQWAGPRRPVWNCIECTRISHPTAQPTPHHVRAEVWMSLIHGSRGLIYFVHEWKPRFNESALLDNPRMLAAVTRLNREVQSLARVLHSPAVTNLVAVRSADPALPVAVTARQDGRVAHVFAVAMRDHSGTVQFDLAEPWRGARVEVIGESRAPARTGTGFEDRFGGWDVHLYRLERPAEGTTPEG